MKSATGKMHNIAKPGAVKVGSKPFSSSWSNSRPMANPGSATNTSPAGKQTQYRDQGKKGTYRGR